MSPFWISLFDQLRHGGRNPAIFLVALACFFLLLGALALVLYTALREFLLWALPFAAIPGLVWMACAVRRSRSERRRRLEFPPLSRDELRVARSKLVKD